LNQSPRPVLPKLPDSIEKDDLLLLWLALFKANTAEELKELNAFEVPELSEAISAIVLIYYRLLYISMIPRTAKKRLSMSIKISDSV